MKFLSGAISVRSLIPLLLMDLIQEHTPMKKSPGENWIFIRRSTSLKAMLPLWPRWSLRGFLVGRSLNCINGFTQRRKEFYYLVQSFFTVFSFTLFEELN